MRPHTPTDHEEALAALIVELTDRLQNGESLDQDTLAAQYPEFANELREYLPSMQVLADLGRLDSPSSDGNGKHDTGSPLPTGTRVLGDFQIHRELGRGGMGVVYEAEQVSMGRRVALKVLPFATMVDEKAILRFKNEVRATATLHHPHIVPVFSVGEERGVHYYAMQLIKGHTLAAVIEQLRAKSQMLDGSSIRQAISSAEIGTTSGYEPTLAPDESSESELAKETLAEAAASTLTHATSREYYRNIASLGIEAADALQHAHEHGIVHRDIKPANLMLDGAGRLWITDFGLAHMESEAGMTMTGDLVGTLRYMSPEQALAKRIVIDNRTDIYSLGATLYEAIALRPMFDGADRQELLKQIALEESRPVRKIDRRIPVELETIIAKAVAKNPDDRYETASELADDLRRIIAHQPIHARRPSLIKRFAKWTQRNSTFAATAAVALILLSTCLTIATAIIDRERRGAEASATSERGQREAAIMERNAAQRAREEEVKARKRAEVIKDQLILALRSPDPKESGPYVKIVDVLRMAESNLETELKDQPDLKAELCLVLADTHFGLGSYQTSAELAELAFQIRRVQYGDDHDFTLNAMSRLGNALAHTMESESVERGVEFLRRVVEIRRAKTPRNSWECSKAENDLVVGLYKMGRDEDASELVQGLLSGNREDKAPDEEELLAAKHNIALACFNSGDRNRGMKMMLDVVHRAENLGLARSYYGLLARESLAHMHFEIGDRVEALSRYEQLLPDVHRMFGDRHPFVLIVANDLALLQSKSGKASQAVAMFERLLPEYRECFGATHANTLALMINTASAYSSLGQNQSALDLYEEVVPLQRTARGKDDPLVVVWMNNLASAHARVGDLNRGIEIQRQVIELRKRILDPTDRQIVDSMQSLGTMLAMADRIDEAIAVHEESIAERRRIGQPEIEITKAIDILVQICLSDDRFSEAEAFAKESLAIRRCHAANGWRTNRTQLSLGIAMAAQGKFDESEVPLNQGFNGLIERIDRLSDHDLEFFVDYVAWLEDIHKQFERPEGVRWQNNLRNVRDTLGPKFDKVARD